MFNHILRSVSFIFGLFSLLDGGLPAVTRTQQVDGHSTWGSSNTSAKSNTRTFSDSCTVQLAHGRVSGCAIDYAAYNSLNDGASVDVTTSWILRKYLKISTNGEAIFSSWHWHWFSIIAGLIVMGAALFGTVGVREGASRGE